MKRREGYFKDERGEKVVYSIHERVTDATFWLEYYKIGDILFYSRRKNQHNIEVKKMVLKVVPKSIRSLDEYDELKEEFYKENLNDIKENNFFECAIEKIDGKYKLDIYGFYKNTVEEYLQKTEMREEELAEYIYLNKKSPYTR